MSSRFKSFGKFIREYNENNTTDSKIDRSSFLYLDYNNKMSFAEPDDFAQCRSCMMWTGGGEEKYSNRCTVHGKEVEVKPDMSCGFYINGKNMKEEAIEGAHLMKLVTPDESGLVEREVRCSNCKHFNSENSICNLYNTLNTEFPEIFNLNVNVNENGCCNANVPK